MKRILLIVIMLCCGCVMAQNTPTIGVLPDNGPTLPATCVIGQLYFRTLTSIGLNACNSPNTWTAVGGGGGGTVSANNGSAGANAYYPAAGGSTTVSASSGLTYDSVGNATLAQGTITVSTPIMNHTVTWNAGGVTFADWASAITCTAAASGSNALTVTVGGTLDAGLNFGANCATPQWVVPAGVTANPSIRSSGSANSGLNIDSTPNVCLDNSGNLGLCENAGANNLMASSEGLGWTSTGLPSGSTGTFDTLLSRSAAGVVSFDTTTKGNSLGTIKPGLYASGTNCAAAGTAANPSVASCAAAPAGSFSCATNASGGTCVVNTTAVTSNSEIFITQRSDTTTGTRLSVTCNTTLTTVIPEITAVTAATSFTINLGTITTNPECFSYYIIN